MINFKQFLKEGIRLFKMPDNQKMWYSDKDYAEAVELPFYSNTRNKLYNEHSSIRMGIDTEGNVWGWNGGIFHKIFWSFVDNKKPFMNLQLDYDDKLIYASFNDIPDNDLQLTVNHIRKNLNIIKKAFPKLKKTFPKCEGVIMGDYLHYLTLDAPYRIKELDVGEEYNV